MISYYSSIVGLTMSVSCTISEILSIISQNSKRSRDRNHAHLRDYLSIQANSSLGQQCTKFEVPCLSQSYFKRTKMRHVTWPRPFQGHFVVHMLGLAMINLHTKFEVCMFTHYEDIKGNAKCRKWDGLGLASLKSSAMSPFDKALTTSYSTPIETSLCVYLVAFSSYSELFVKSRLF